jgi:hypothetical protein
LSLKFLRGSRLGAAPNPCRARLHGRALLRRGAAVLRAPPDESSQCLETPGSSAAPAETRWESI